MDALRIEYEKTALHRMGISMERALARVSWLRAVLEVGVKRNQQQPATIPAQAAAGR